MSELESAKQELTELRKSLGEASDEVKGLELFPEVFSRRADIVTGRIEYFSQTVMRARAAIERFRSATAIPTTAPAGAAVNELSRELAEITRLLQQARADLYGLRDALEAGPKATPTKLKERLWLATEKVNGVAGKLDLAKGNAEYNRKAQLARHAAIAVVGAAVLLTLFQHCDHVESERTSRTRACYEAAARAALVGRRAFEPDKCRESENSQWRWAWPWPIGATKPQVEGGAGADGR